jgi:hypothetical protein
MINNTDKIKLKKRTGKMQKIYKVILILSVPAVAWFALDFLTTNQNVISGTTILNEAMVSQRKVSESNRYPSDMAYAIVIMPKSYQGLLKRFSNHRLAKDIKILPAQILWNEGKMVVQPKEDFSRRLATEDIDSKTVEKLKNQTHKQLKTSKAKIVENAAMMILLASATNKTNFKSGP